MRVRVAVFQEQESNVRVFVLEGDHQGGGALHAVALYRPALQQHLGGLQVPILNSCVQCGCPVSDLCVLHRVEPLVPAL